MIFAPDVLPTFDPASTAQLAITSPVMTRRQDVYVLGRNCFPVTGKATQASIAAVKRHNK
jgi:hypothetical protein